MIAAAEEEELLGESKGSVLGEVSPLLEEGESVGLFTVGLRGEMMAAMASVAAFAMVSPYVGREVVDSGGTIFSLDCLRLLELDMPPLLFVDEITSAMTLVMVPVIEDGDGELLSLSLGFLCPC